MSFWSKSASVRSHQHQRISRASNTSPPFPKQQVYFQTKNLNFDIVNPMVCYFFPGNDTRPTHSLLWPNNGIFFPAVFFPRTHSLLWQVAVFFFPRCIFFQPYFHNFNVFHLTSDGEIVTVLSSVKISHSTHSSLYESSCILFWRNFLSILVKLKNNFVCLHLIFSFWKNKAVLLLF